MTVPPRPAGSHVILDLAALRNLIAVLRDDGRQVIGPRVEQQTIVLGPVHDVDDLPAGVRDEQAPGRYRLRAGETPRLFGFASPVQGWKRYLHPPSEVLWRARRRGHGFGIEEVVTDEPGYALLGVRACDLRALSILDRVLGGDQGADPRYHWRRQRAFVIAVTCSHPGATCFCASMGAGPSVEDDHDVLLTELVDVDRHVFVARAGSAAGEAMLGRVPSEAADARDVAAAEAVVAEAKASMGRTMPERVETILRDNLDHARWADVAERCLACGNCTMVCPTCFCASVEDRCDLTGVVAERWRCWDSCFSLEFSYVHGGSIRRSTLARYRQWMTHKLSFWHEQFGSSGCVGCGRCITWCPVGIDITEEATAIQQARGERP
jgi:ferredoxin